MKKRNYIQPDIVIVTNEDLMDLTDGGVVSGGELAAKEGFFFDETDSAYTTDEVVVEPYEEDDDQPWSVTYHYSPWED